MSQEQRIALVTGASRGIGAAIADRLQESGLFVIGTATSPAGAEKISARLSQGRGAVLDVTEVDSIKALFAEIKAQHGGLHVLVNNAGITRDNLFVRMKDEEWDAVLSTNLTALFRVCRQAVPMMIRKRWGRVINITSVVGHMGNMGQANYAAAKAGVQGMSKSLAREIGRRGVTVNCVAPGYIQTDMTRALDENVRKQWEENIPLRRFGGVREVADAVDFLASDRAAYITGESLHVNGGLYM